jgi:hypothetical protein
MNNGEETPPTPAETPPAPEALPAVPPAVEPSAPMVSAAAPTTAPPGPAATAPVQPEKPPAPVPSLASRWLRKWPVALVALVLLAVAFYVEENARGKSAWEGVKKKLEAQQEPLAWAAFVPPAAPDEQNFFKAPKMREWFTGPGASELTARLSSKTFMDASSQPANSGAAVMVAELILRPPDSVGGIPSASSAQDQVVADITFDDAPLSFAIQHLAKQGNFAIQVDSQGISARRGSNGKTIPEAMVNCHWKKTTLAAALSALICNYNLRWVKDPKTGAPLIQAADLPGAAGGAKSASRDYVSAIILNSIGRLAPAGEGFTLSAGSLSQNGPVHLSVTPDSIPMKSDLARLFPTNAALRIEPSGNALEIILGHAPVAAADYLAWSGQFSNELDRLREAVQRPVARLDGDYGQLHQVPSISFPAVKVAADLLADRAECFLMSGQPEAALAELTLLNDLSGCLEGKPSGKPMTLARVWGNLPAREVFAERVAEGLRWQVWREPELAALQDQLGRMDMIALVWNALESERAGECLLLETAPRSEAAVELGLSETKGFWTRFAGTRNLVFTFMPQGWAYQNMARVAALDQHEVDSVDRIQGFIRPHLVEGGWAQILAGLRRTSPYSFLAKKAITSAKTPLLAATRAQTLINQALVACALERCYLANGVYPEKLDALVPQFIPVLPVDPVNGAPLKYKPGARGHFLLYSIGWNEKDDHGAPADGAGNGDWVWGRP